MTGLVQPVLEASSVRFVLESTGQFTEIVGSQSFSLHGGELFAIIGPSGSGKTTLARMLAGVLQPSEGTVFLDGVDVHEVPEYRRQHVGFVPQDDILHRELGLGAALEYAARIRLAPESGAHADWAVERARSVADTVNLGGQWDTRIGDLSGGERRRAALAMELLAQPNLLVLDEPTTGLDPALDRSVMQTLRGLADEGRIVALVTHNVANIELADRVLLLGADGHPRYLGPPAALFDSLGVSDWAGAYARANEAGAAFEGDPASPGAGGGAGVAPQVVQPRRRRQLGTLVARQFALGVGNRSHWVFTLIQPVIIGILALLVPGVKGLGAPNASEPAEPTQILVILVFGAGFMGLALGIRDLVSERSIYRREHDGGLRIGAYLGSKVTVFTAIVAVQCAVALGVSALGKPGPVFSVFGTSGTDLFSVLGGWFGIYLALVLTAIASCCVGLALSALLRSEAQLMPTLVVVSMLQLVFSGGLIPVTERVVLEQVAWFFPTRWGYAASASATNVNDLVPFMTPDALWEATTTQYLWDLTALLGLAALALSIAYLRLRRGYAMDRSLS